MREVSHLEQRQVGNADPGQFLWWGSFNYKKNTLDPKSTKIFMADGSFTTYFDLFYTTYCKNRKKL